MNGHRHYQNGFWKLTGTSGSGQEVKGPEAGQQGSGGTPTDFHYTVVSVPKGYEQMQQRM